MSLNQTVTSGFSRAMA